jgi:hypothetical protein
VLLRMMAAIALGPDVLAPPATFEPVVFLVAMLVHYSLSMIYAFIGVGLLYRFTRWIATLLGGLLGLALYLINFSGFVALFPWFIEARHEVAVLVHIVFGAMHGCACVSMLRRR